MTPAPDAAPAPGAAGVGGDRDPPGQTGGYVRVYRSLLEHPLWTTVPDAWLRVALAILLRANWRPVSLPTTAGRINLPPGSLLTSSEKLAQLSRTSRQQVRDALGYLESTRFITTRRTSHYTITTVTNWAPYQGDNQTGNQRRNQQRTSKEPAGEPTENQQRNPRSDGPSEPSGDARNRSQEPVPDRQKNHRGRNNHHQAATQQTPPPAPSPPSGAGGVPGKGKADDEESWEDPDAELLRRLQRRHGNGTDCLRLKALIRGKLDPWEPMGVTLADFLTLDRKQTTGKVRTPEAYYTALVDSLLVKARGKLHNNPQKLQRAVNEAARQKGWL